MNVPCVELSLGPQFAGASLCSWMYRSSHQRDLELEMDINRFRAPSHGGIKEGYARSRMTELKSDVSGDELPLDPYVATVLLE